eukprot:1868054-Pyramimonas_sp.AAC.2
MEKLLDHVPIGMSGAENLSAEHAAQFVLHGQSEDVSDLQSQGGSSHSIEKNEEYARFHTSPGPSYHLDPLPDRCVELASGAAPLVSEAADHVTGEVIQKPILDSDDDFEKDEPPDRDGCSSAEHSRRRAPPTLYAQ